MRIFSPHVNRQTRREVCEIIRNMLAISKFFLIFLCLAIISSISKYFLAINKRNCHQRNFWASVNAIAIKAGDGEEWCAGAVGSGGGFGRRAWKDKNDGKCRNIWKDGR
jgi:hypothetical protein